MNTPAAKPTQPKTRPLVLKERYEEILKTVYHYRFVTVTDVTKLFFSYPSSYKYAGKILSQLAGGNDYIDRQYLYRFPLPDTKPGNTERIYTLGALGYAYLKETLGVKNNWHFNPTSVREMSYQLCLHALTLTHFLVEAEVYCRKQEHLNLYQVVTEYELRALPKEQTLVKLTGKTGSGAISVIPDAWLNFERLKEGQHASFAPILLEIDRGSEYQESFKRHLTARLSFINPNGQYKALFGTNAVKIAYLTTAGQERVANMVSWTQAVLEEEKKKNWAPLFHFCSQPKDKPFTPLLFSAPLWIRPDEKTPVLLLS